MTPLGRFARAVQRQAVGLVRNPDIQMIRDLIYLGIGQIGVKLVGFLIYAYLARRLSTDDYGALESVLAVVGLLAVTVDFGLGSAGVRYRTQHAGRPEAEKVIGVVVALRLSLSILAATGLMIGVVVLWPGPEMMLLCSFLALALVLQSFGQEWLLQSMERMRDVALAQFLRTVALAIAVMLMIRDTHQMPLYGVAEAISVVVAMGYMMHAIRRAGVRLRLSLDRQVTRDMVKLAFPQGANALMWGATQSLPVVIVGSLAGLEPAAYFAAGLRLVVSLQSLSYIYHFNMYPALTRRYFEGTEALVKLSLSSLRIIAWACVGPSILMSANAGAVMAVLYGESFRAAGPVMSVLVFAIPLQVLAGHHRWALTAAGQGASMLAQGIGGLSVSIVGCAVLVLPFGAVGGAVAVVLAGWAVWYVAILYCRRSGFHIPVLGRLVLPVAAGCAATLCADLLSLHGAMELITFVIIYVAIGLIVDRRRIYADLKFVAYSKETRRNDGNVIG